MIQRFVHSHPFYKSDNATAYAQLVISTLGSQYAYMVSPFRRAKKGRVEINALKAQFSGAAHLEREVKVHMEFLLNGKWNGQTSTTLYMLLSKHRASFHSIQRCGDHVTVETLSERTCVGHLLEKIESND